MWQSIGNLLITLLCALAGGFLMAKTKMPGAVILGAMAAVAALKLLRSGPFPLPPGGSFLLQVLVGASVGLMIDAQLLATLRAIILPVFLSALALVVTGLIVSVFVARTGLLDTVSAYIGTSPGAMAALVGMAASMKVNAPVVLVFHVFRIILIIATAPLVIKFLNWVVGR